MARSNRDHLLIFLLTLIGIEFLTTLWLVPLSREAILVTTVAVVISLIFFVAMIRYRRQNLPVR